MHVVNTLAPVFLVITLGALLRWRGFLDAAGSNTINRCCYWVGLPVLLFSKIATASAPAAAAASTAWLMTVSTLALGCAAFATAWFMRLQPVQTATFVHVVARGNLAYIGLPVVILAFAETPFAETAASVAALSLGPTILLYNVASVAIHLVSAHRMDRRMMTRVVVKLVTNPLILSTLAGLAWNGLAGTCGIDLPVFAWRTVDLLGSFTLPMALLCVGSALAETPLRGVLRAKVAASLLKIAAGPLIALAIARLAGAGPMESGIVAILMATPTAVASYVLVDQLDGDTALAAGTIVLSTLLSAISLGIVVAWVG